MFFNLRRNSASETSFLGGFFVTTADEICCLFLIITHTANYYTSAFIYQEDCSLVIYERLTIRISGAASRADWFMRDSLRGLRCMRLLGAV
jgi:hypothetical protein